MTSSMTLIPGERAVVHEPLAAEPPRPLFRQPPASEEYPVDALGPVLAPVATAIAQLTQAAPAICANAVLSVASLATQAHADVILPTGQSRPLTLFILTIAASGERKTSADREALDGVRGRERELRESYKQEIIGFKNAKDAYESARTAAMKSAKGDRVAARRALDALGPEPEPPIRPILVMTEPTVEGLVKLLADSPTTVGLFSSEGGSFIGGHALSDESKLRSAARLSALWDGEPIDRVRSAAEATVIVGKRVAIHLMAQEEAAMRFLSDATLRDQGLLSRLLVCAPTPSRGTRFFRHPSLESRAVVDEFSFRIQRLLSAIPPDADRDRPGLQLDEGATHLFIRWHDAVERELSPGGKFDPIRGFAAKLAEHAARIAAVIALTGDPATRIIDAAAMAAGTRLADFYAAETLKQTESASVSASLRSADRLLTWLQGRGAPLVHLAEVYQRGPAELRDQASALAALRVLEEHGSAARLENGAELDGCFRRSVWRLTAEA